jgi:hypothetical protein
MRRNSHVLLECCYQAASVAADIGLGRCVPAQALWRQASWSKGRLSRLEGAAQMTHSSRNTLKTALLLGLLSALILLAGQAIGGSGGLLLAGMVTLLINGGA